MLLSLRPVRTAMTAGAVCLAVACGGPEARPAAPADPPPIPSDHPRPAAAPALPAGPVLSEAEARAILAERFRAAGFRVRYDVPIARPGAFELTVDGYDPERGIGFEYVAVDERGTDLDDSERAALARDREHRILIVDATDAAGLDALVSAFLARHRP
jgi:hypothetical protein